MLLLRLVVWMHLAVAVSVHASEIEYHPAAKARLGYGFDPERPTILYATRALKPSVVENIDTTGIVEGSVAITEVKSRRELLERIGVSASVQAHSAFASGSASMSQIDSVSFDSSSLVWVASIKTVLGRYRLTDTIPTQALENEKPERISGVFGSEIVTQETRGAIASVVYEASNLTTEQKQALSAAIAASYKSGAAGGSAKSNYEKLLSDVQKTSEIKTQIHVQGGPGHEYLAPFINASSDIAAIRQALTTYIKKTDAKNAKPLSYSTSPISQFRNIVIRDAPNLSQDRLWELYESYANLTTIIRRLDTLTKPTNQSENYLRRYISEDKRKALQQTRQDYDQARERLREAAMSLIAGKSAPLPDLSLLTRIDWPNIPPAPYAIFPAQYYWGLPSPPLERSELKFVEKNKTSRGSTLFPEVPVIILGDPALLARVELVEKGSRTPLKVRLLDRNAPAYVLSEKDRALARMAGKKLPFDPLQEWLKTIVEGTHIDANKTIGLAAVPVPGVYEQDRLFTIEVHDVLGRVSTQNFNSKWEWGKNP